MEFACAGKAIQVYARAYPKSSSRAVYLKAARDGGELPAYDQYPATQTASIDKLQSRAPRSRFLPLRKACHYGDDSSRNTPTRNLDDLQSGLMLPAASAAAALAQLHNHKLERDWDSEGDWMSDSEAHKHAMRSSIELPPIYGNNIEPTSEPNSHLNMHRRRELLPSILSASPPGRSSTLPPIQRSTPNRPRKQSVSKRAREPQHKRQKSRGENAHLRRMSYDRKAYSAEPSSGLSATYGKRWEDLIDAATSATEDVDEDRTPVPPSPISVNRNSLPPFSASHFQGYQASPLQQALTPPSNLPEAPEPFPSVESAESGDIFNIESRGLGLSDSSPGYSSQSIQIYCAACQGVSLLRESYACTECICGICQACVDVLIAEQGARRKCPRCATIGGRFKPFQLDIR
ncbi:Uncharacterized protein BP5553_05991 [Venustampulla echinocandica]|uniref:RING zinc finger-like domain-containing protein n=1 Tax=Venustampulla echinocandica TaxID=2656787 RepID=A0A370TM90_9HELO|nr:Uncharacterized protein BP5553_05991 [Venustampulla echinocandica]RDL36639.1 Uncharacterized protein BP5553_05991 [Venustampulla echinocandica]